MRYQYRISETLALCIVITFECQLSFKNSVPFRVPLQLQSFYVIQKRHASNQHRWLDSDRVHQGQ